MISANRILTALVFTLAAFLLPSCGDDNGTGPVEPPVDTIPPLALIEHPPDNAVIGDTVTIRVTSADTVEIAKVEFYIDGSHAITADDSIPPFEYIWDVSALEIGSAHTLHAMVYDTAGNSGSSDTVTVHYLWRLLVADGDEGQARDIRNVFVRSTDTTLEFRVQTNGDWGDYRSTSEGIDVAFFLDTDRDASTGKDSVANETIPINDIGAEYRAIIGYHGDSLARYDDYLSAWQPVHGAAGFAYRNIVNDTNTFEIGVSLSQIGSPDTIDIVVANVLLTTNPYTWDWAPDAGHVTYNVDGLLLGSSRAGRVLNATK